MFRKSCRHFHYKKYGCRLCDHVGVCTHGSGEAGEMDEGKSLAGADLQEIVGSEHLLGSG